jgi:hypothetical protein
LVPHSNTRLRVSKVIEPPFHRSRSYSNIL